MLEPFDLLLTNSDLSITQKKVERTVLPECEKNDCFQMNFRFPTVYLWLGGAIIVVM
jgi:hypothetical protein